MKWDVYEGENVIMVMVIIMYHYLMGQKDQQKEDTSGIIVDMLVMGSVTWMRPEMRDIIWMNMHN